MALAAGTGETSAGADEEEHRVNREDGGDGMESDPEQGGGGDGLEGVAGEDDGALVVAVGDVAGGQHEEEPGQEQCEAGVAERERGVGDLVDLPGDGDGLRLGAEDDKQPRGLIEAEIF